MFDYKKIIKNENTRYRIIRTLSMIPDKEILQIQYRIKTGRKLNLNNPRRYSEKIQWYKLNYRNELMSQCADKFDVREYVVNKGYPEVLNECYGVYSSFEDIDWDKLPKQFVLKDTLGGGGRSMIFVYDKDAIDFDEVKNIIEAWTSIPINQKSLGREWIYEGRKHRIIAEKLLVNDKNDDLPDYKFFCFNGEVFCSYMMQNYTMHHDLGVLGFLDRDFKLLKAHRADFAPLTKQPEKPKNYERMVSIAECLASEFPHVRVDFYNLDGRIIFGEMTFFNASGYIIFDPDEFDYEMGNAFDLPEVKQTVI